MTGQDPFSATIAAMWRIIEASPELSERIEPGNRIKRADHRLAQKRRVQDADLPELDISPGPISDIQWTSTGVRLSRAFTIAIATGTGDIDRHLLPLEWEIVRAFSCSAKPGALDLGLDFVVQASVSSAEPSEDDSDARRGRSGWSSIMTVDVRYLFAKIEHVEEGRT